MKKVAEVQNILRYFFEGGVPFLLTSDLDNLKWKSTLNCSILADVNITSSHNFRIGNYWLRAFENFGQVYVYDENEQCVKIFPEGFNLPSSKFWENGNLLIPNRVTKTHWELSTELDLTDTSHLFKFDKCINGRYYIYMYPPNLLTRINIYNQEIIWQVRPTDYLSIASSEEIIVKDHPLSYQDYIYFQLESGELFSLNSETSSLEWMVRHEFSGPISIYNDKIYKRSNKLYEICAKTGKTEKEKLIKEIVGGSFSATGRIISYEDVIVLWDVKDSEVVMINRDDFSLADKVKINSIGIGNQEGVIEWHDDKLYVLDMERTLHIFERD